MLSILTFSSSVSFTTAMAVEYTNGNIAEGQGTPHPNECPDIDTK